MSEELSAVFGWQGQNLRVKVCPTCWVEREDLVPLLLEMVGTFSMVLPDGTEVKRMAGSYRFCVRCSWTDQRGVMADPISAEPTP